MTASGRVMSVLVGLVLCVAAVGVGCAVRAALPGLGTPPAMAEDKPADQPARTAGLTKASLPQAVAELVPTKGHPQGKVFIGKREVLETLYPHQGIEAYERASTAAARINLALQEGAAPEDFRAVNQNGEWLVIARDRVIVSINRREPEAHKLSEQALAEKWATNISLALYEALGKKPGAEIPLPPLAVEPAQDTADGAEIGVLLVNGHEVLRLAAPAPGHSPYERARIVADRLRKAVSQGALPQDIHAADAYGMWVVQISEMLLITVDEQDARAAHRSPEALAHDWATRLADAVAEHYAAAGKPIQPVSQDWRPEEQYSEKWVPVISLLEGVKLGIARVNGPISRIRLVQAVAQLETHWKDYLEVDIYIPISTKVPGKSLDRVQGCAVTGLGDIRL